MYKPNDTFTKIEENKITVDEIKLLMKLNGGQRLPHLENEIFSKFETGCAYLNEIRSKKLHISSASHGTCNPGYTICAYALYVINGRWFEAEKFLLMYGDSTWVDVYRNRYCGV